MGSLRNKKKAKQALGKYNESKTLLGTSDRRQQLEDEIENYERAITKLKKIDPKAVEGRDEMYIAELYSEVGEKFEPPVTQGLKEVLPGQKINFSGKFRLADFQVNGSVDGEKLAAALEASLGPKALAEVEFKDKFGAARGDIELFLGAMGATNFEAQYNWDKLAAELVGSFFVGAQVECNGELRAGSVDNNLKAEVSGKASVGFEASGKANFELTPTQMSAGLELSAFAGAKAEATSKFTVNLFGRSLFETEVNAKATLGIGADLTAKLDVGVQKIGMKFDADYAFKWGTGAGYEVTANVGNFVMSFLEMKENVLSAARHMEGYRNLGLQDKEWQLKIDAITKTYVALLKKKRSDIKKLGSS